MKTASGSPHVVAVSGGDLLFAPGLSAYMEGNGPLSASKTPLAAGAKPDEPLPRFISQYKFMPWGEQNDFPQQVIDLYERDTIIPRTLLNQLAQLLGGGILPVTQTVGPDLKPVNVPVNDPRINAFLDELVDYLQQTGEDLLWFFNAIPELILSKDRSQIVQLAGQHMAYGRYAPMSKAGRCESVYLNANWPRANADDEYTIEVPTLDVRRLDKVDWLQNQSGYKYIYPLKGPSPGRSVYALAPHDAIRTSGWLEIHAAIPQFKKFLMKNQMSIKYHIKVDAGYWPLVYGVKAWKDMSAAQQMEKKKEWLKAISDNLTNVENTGNTILSETSWVGPADKPYLVDYVSIMPVVDPLQSGKYIEDNMEAAANIFYALGTDPAVVGFASKDMGSRSGGSDKREAFLIGLTMMSILREKILEPIRFTAAYNGWRDQYPGLTFVFADTILTTLDTGAGTKKVVS